MGGKSTKADQTQFKDMNLNYSDKVDGCHQSKAAAQDSARMNYSMSQDMNSQPATKPLDRSFQMQEDHMEGILGTFPILRPKQEMFWLGRAKASDYVFRELNMGGSKWLNAARASARSLRTALESFSGTRAPMAPG